MIRFHVRIVPHNVRAGRNPAVSRPSLPRPRRRSVHWAAHCGRGSRRLAPPRRAVRRPLRVRADEAAGLLRPPAGRLGAHSARSRRGWSPSSRRPLRARSRRAAQHRRWAPRAQAGDRGRRPLRHPTDVPGYLGANNSATGVGAVIAIARALKGDRRVPGQAAVRFVLFDGEEAPTGYADFYTEGLRGSRAYAAAHAKEIREVIVLDFIALHDLSCGATRARQGPSGRRLPLGRRACQAPGRPYGASRASCSTTTRRSSASDPRGRPDRLPLPVLAEGLRRTSARCRART